MFLTSEGAILALVMSAVVLTLMGLLKGSFCAARE
jgi:hypothetical protein